MTEPKSGANPLFLTEDALRQGLELMIVAHLELSRLADDPLSRHGLGRAHRRVLYFLGRRPGTTISELIPLLRVSKQSLSRVVGDLVGRGLVERRRSPRDQRQRALFLTAGGEDLDGRIWEAERRWIARAYRRAGADAVDGFKTVVAGLLGERATGALDRTGAIAGRGVV